MIYASLNAKEFLAGLEHWVARKGLNIARGMLLAGEHLLKKSREIVPIDTKALYDSGAVYSTGSGYRTQLFISYGSATVKYALYVHEDLTALHGSAYNARYAAQIAAGITHARRPQEQAKFLEQPFRQERNIMRAILIAEVRK